MDVAVIMQRQLSREQWKCHRLSSSPELVDIFVGVFSEFFALTLLMRLLILGVGELDMLSLTLVVTCLGSVVAGTLVFLIFIDFSMLFLELWSIMMGGMVLLLILWYGLLVHIPRGVAWFMRFGTGPFCLGHLVFGVRNG